VFAAAAIALGFLVLPIVAIFARVTPGKLVAQLSHPVVTDALVLSLKTSAIAQALVVLVGTPAAYVLATRRFPGRSLAVVLVELPLVLPPAVAGTGARVYVDGPTAAFVDIGDRIESRMPLFFGAVIGLSCLLLIAVFRSVVVALKAAVMNLLSIGASYGVIVAIFQWGWLSGLFGVLWAAALVTAGAAMLASVTRLNPLWLLLAGGVLGFAGFIG